MCCSLWIAALNTSRISKPAGISFLEEKRKNDDCVQAGETRLKGGQGMRHTKCWIVAVASLLALAPFSSSKNPSAVDAEKRSEEHTSELQSPCNLVCRLLLEKKKQKIYSLHA